jgi:hypothetical protein
MNIIKSFRRFSWLGLALFGLAGGVGVMAQEAIEFVASAPKVVAVGEAFRVSFSVNAKADHFSGPRSRVFTFLARCSLPA